MNIVIDFKKTFTTPREVALILWQNAVLSHELEYLCETEVENNLFRPHPITVDEITEIVCKYFNIEIKHIQKVTRKREVVQCRQIIHYFCKEYTKESLYRIGLFVGGKDHATVKHSVKTVNNLCDSDSKFKKQIKELDKQIR
jgi:chromosomal replication initiation ATPase DnaA